MEGRAVPLENHLIVAQKVSYDMLQKTKNICPYPLPQKKCIGVYTTIHNSAKVDISQMLTTQCMDKQDMIHSAMEYCLLTKRNKV